MDLTAEQAQLKRELVNEHKLEENIQNDVEKNKTMKIVKKHGREVKKYGR